LIINRFIFYLGSCFASEVLLTSKKATITINKKDVFIMHLKMLKFNKYR